MNEGERGKGVVSLSSHGVWRSGRGWGRESLTPGTEARERVSEIAKSAWLVSDLPSLRRHFSGEIGGRGFLPVVSVPLPPGNAGRRLVEECSTGEL